jgi:hypothetical protein
MNMSRTNFARRAALLANAAVIIACGGDKTTEPTSQTSPPAALRLIIPDTVTRGQAFTLTGPTEGNP